MSIASHNRLAAGRLVCFHDPRTDEQRTGRVVESEWAASFGTPRSRLTVRADGQRLTITDSDLCR